MSEIDLSGVDIEKDVAIGKAGGRDLLADIYRPPAGVTKRTALLHLHGGGFRGGSKDGARLARHMAALGYAGIASQYRLSAEAKWPAQLHDVKTAIRWTHANSSALEVDRVVLFGYSAGGQLSLIAAGSQNDPALEGEGGSAGEGTEVAACVALYPPTAMAAGPDGSVPEPMAADATQDDYREASPIVYAAPGFPPTVLLHGTADTTVPFESSLEMFHALQSSGIPVELHLLPGLLHAFDAYPDLAEQAARTIDFFLDRHVLNPREYPAMSRAGAPR